MTVRELHAALGTLIDEGKADSPVLYYVEHEGWFEAGPPDLRHLYRTVDKYGSAEYTDLAHESRLNTVAVDIS